MEKIIIALVIVLFGGQARGQAIMQNLSGTWKSPHDLGELAAAPVSLIPYPQKVTWKEGNFILRKTWLFITRITPM
ncbi:hypothetical protein [Niabella hibiscisoli]|uniref:hypothetical protein n=1 Tax=Niabella hibiscisoli TaxID=1825928 RepID=UPI001F0F7DF7|nr:hypothetical protein [Niabella hibiscisoli]MCH5719273.1 hypothetical protein [Niabella hibiscisoli]